MSQTKKLGVDEDGPEVTIDANGHCELPAGMTSVPVEAFSDWDGRYEGCTALKSIGIPSSVTAIGMAAFDRCISLEAVSIPPSVTAIEQCTFIACFSIRAVGIPTSVTSIGEGAFDS